MCRELPIVTLKGPSGTVRLIHPPAMQPVTNLDPLDLTQFAPQGNSIFGLSRQDINPFALAPPQNANSGIVFFDIPRQDDFHGLLRILGITKRHNFNQDERDNRYWAVEHVSEQPGQDGYLKQLRVIDRFGLRFLYGALDQEGYESFPVQPLTLPELLWAFIFDQVKEYGTGLDGAVLAGKFGGDGNLALEALSFGLMVENSYMHVYRIWSRAWLVTK